MASTHRVAEVCALPRSRKPPQPPRTRVLIVDDIADNRRLLTLLCDQFGFASDSVEGGREAVEAARTGGYDLVLMDIFMPKMDGMEATRAIRALPGRASSTPIIAVTTAAEPGERLRYLACGMTDVVAKPVSPARLMEAAASALAAAEDSVRPQRRRRRA